MNSLGLPTASGATNFAEDSLIPSWAKAQVKAATDAGYVTGFDTKDGSVFNAAQRITRAEIAVIAARVLKTAGTAPSGAGKTFDDAKAIPAWALDAVSQTTAVGIVSGYPDGSFRPDDTLTRAEAVKVAYALLETLNI